MAKNVNKLRVLRAERRITQIDLATKAGIPMTRYWKIENGYVDPTPGERGRIARALKATTNEAFPSSHAVAS